MAARVSTKVVAKPMLKAESSFFDTPINGHRPRNLTRTTLLTRAVPNKSKRYSLTVVPGYLMADDKI
jgi:hypothetical protein